MQLKREYNINEVSQSKVLLIFNVKGICVDIQTTGTFLLPITKSKTINVHFNNIFLLSPLSQFYSISRWMENLNEPRIFEYSLVTDAEQYKLTAEVVNISNCFLQISVANQAEKNTKYNSVRLQSNSKTLLSNMLNSYALFKLRNNRILSPENFVIIDANSKFEGIVKQTHDDVIGKNLFDLFPESFSGILEKISVVLQDQSKIDFPIYLSEFEKYIRVTAYSPAKDFIGLIIEDVTVEKEHLTNLIHSNKLQEILAESTMEAILAFSSTRCIACNTAAKNLFDFTATDYSSVSITDILDSDYIDAVMSKISERDSNPFILMLKSLNGRQFPAELRITQTDYQNSKMNIIAVRDISQLKNTEEDLVASEEKFRKIVESLCDTVFSTDVNANILYLSASFEDLTGFEVKNFFNIPFTDILIEDGSDILRYQFSKLEYNSYTHEYKLKCADSSYKWVKVITFPVKKENEILGFNGVIIDIDSAKRTSSQKEELQKQLMHTQKMEALGVLAGGIAHDFNNILSVIIGYAEISEYEVDKTNDVLSALHEIQVAGNRAKTLVKQILSFSRKSIEDSGPVIVKPIMKEAVKLLRSSAPPTVKIITDINIENQIIAEPAKLHQVILNLCTNALYAVNKETGEIRVSLKKTCFKSIPLTCRMEIENKNSSEDFNLENVLEIKVSDNGCGIPEENIKKVLEPYFTTKPVNQGTGLGLSIVHSIVKSFGGSIHIGSTLNKGTAIRVFFPVCKQTEFIAQEKEKSEFYMNGLRVIYIDDEPSLGQIFYRRMRRAGCNVLVFNNPLIALREIMNNPDISDIIVCDIGMAQMTGYQFYDNLRTENIKIPLIFCTGYSSKVEQKFSMKEELPLTISKPINFNSLLCYLKKINLNKKILS